MGFFSGIWDSIKGAVRSIGKTIKSAVTSVGKFVNKLGVVGQIGLMFVLPGIGGMMSKGFSALTSGLVGSSSGILQGIGHVLSAAGKFGSTVGNVFKSVSDAVTGFVKTVGGGAVNSASTLLGSYDL
jgi:phage-related protein